MRLRLSLNSRDEILIPGYRHARGLARKIPKILTEPARRQEESVRLAATRRGALPIGSRLNYTFFGVLAIGTLGRSNQKRDGLTSGHGLGQVPRAPQVGRLDRRQGADLDRRLIPIPIARHLYPHRLQPPTGPVGLELLACHR